MQKQTHVNLIHEKKLNIRKDLQSNGEVGSCEQKERR